MVNTAPHELPIVMQRYREKYGNGEVDIAKLDKIVKEYKKEVKKQIKKVGKK